MAGTVKATHWGYTLNNYTPEELILVRRATTVDPIVEHIHTPEQGESGTPHIQGWFRCSRQVRMTHLKKHWLPRANFTALNSDEYRANMRNYVQKQDATATGATAQQRRVEPMLYPALIPELVVRWIADNTAEHDNPPSHDTVWRWVKDCPPEWSDYLLRHADEVKALRYSEKHDEWRWKRCDRAILLGSHEAPLELVVELAKRELVRQHRVETLVDRPEVSKAVRSYFEAILERITHTRENASQDETHLPEADDEEDGSPSPPSGTPDSPSDAQRTGTGIVQ